MAKPGDKNYKGPVSEGWGRPIDDAIKAIDQHVKNASGIPGDVDKNVRKAIGDILGMNKPKATPKKTARKQKGRASMAVKSGPQKKATAKYRKSVPKKNIKSDGRMRKTNRKTGGGGAGGGGTTNRKA